MKSDLKIGDILMGGCFVLLGAALLGLALRFVVRGDLPARFGGRIVMGTLSFAIIELVIVCVGAMALAVGWQTLRRARSGRHSSRG